MLQQIRRRDLILLLGAISLACVSLITVVLFVLRTQPPQQSTAGTLQEATSTPGPAPTHTISFVQITGLGQYPIAERAAKSWSEDAQLVSANANWPQILNKEQVGEPTTWNYRFYSPEERRLFFAFVAPDGQIQTIEHQVPITLPPKIIQLDDWSLDSGAALGLWLDYGGDELVRTNPGLELVVQLRTTNRSPNPVWMVVGWDERTNDLHIIAVDATAGGVVTTSPPEQ